MAIYPSPATNSHAINTKNKRSTNCTKIVKRSVLLALLVLLQVPRFHWAGTARIPPLSAKFSFVFSIRSKSLTIRPRVFYDLQPLSNSPLIHRHRTRLLALSGKRTFPHIVRVLGQLPLSLPYRREANHVMRQYVALATFMDPRNPFQKATRLLPNATQPTSCCN